MYVYRIVYCFLWLRTQSVSFMTLIYALLWVFCLHICIHASCLILPRRRFAIEQFAIWFGVFKGWMGEGKKSLRSNINGIILQSFFTPKTTSASRVILSHFIRFCDHLFVHSSLHSDNSKYKQIFIFTKISNSSNVSVTFLSLSRPRTRCRSHSYSLWKNGWRKGLNHCIQILFA